MPKLSCGARSCVNNEGGMCGATYIMIERSDSETSLQTYCSNYREDTVIDEGMAIGNTNYIGGLMQAFSSMDDIKMDPDVDCHATNCVYNLNGKCEARNVAISVAGFEGILKARCETFAD